MYRHCTHCSAGLGWNEAIESFPVGRRLAFDGARGRLWVICRRCERWNLTPLEERWEALEECERAYRHTRTRYSTENVGLARLREGLDLVRIGEALRPELAAWRYGDQFGRRRLRFAGRGALLLGAGAGVGAAVGVAPLLPLHLGILSWMGFELASHVHRLRSPPVRIPLSDGSTLPWRRRTITSFPKIRPGGPEGSDWHLWLPHEEGEAVLTGGDAVRALGVIMPRANPTGGGRKNVRRAVRELDLVGDAHRYFTDVERRARAQGWGYGTVMQLPPPLNLAVEMAAHEEKERRALEGELHLLERQWQEAEKIAAIADDLALPDGVREKLDELRSRAGRERGS